MGLIWLSTPLVQEFAEHKQLKTSGLGSRVLLDTEKWQEENSFLAETASAVQDLALLARSQAAPEALTLLCLRCRVKLPLKAWLQATHRQFQTSCGIELLAIAGFALDD